MLRSAFIVFIVGWVIWFAIDKPPLGRPGLPQPGDSIAGNFQRAFDMLKSGHPDVAYVYLWDAHYLLLSVLGGILVAVLYGSVSDFLGRRRMRRHFQPPVRSEGKPARKGDETPPEQSDAPADK
jgi:hypothetical protein